MSTEENKALVRRFYEESFDRRNLAVYDELVAEDFIGHSLPPGTPPGRAGLKQLNQMILPAAQDWQTTIDDQVAEGDTVASRFTLRFTQTGAFFGIPATGQQVTLTGIAIDRLVGGKVVEQWAVEDVYGLLLQLGALPAMGQTQA